METWNSESNQARQMLLAGLSSAAGLAIIIAASRAGGQVTNARAGLALGTILLGIGLASFVASGKQRVAIDPKTRRITVEDRTFWGAKRREIGFDEVEEVQLGYLGRRSNLVTYYYLHLRLRGGEDYVLFAPGRFYSGGSERETVAGWRRRLEGYLWPGGMIPPREV